MMIDEASPFIIDSRCRMRREMMQDAVRDDAGCGGLEQCQRGERSFDAPWVVKQKIRIFLAMRPDVCFDVPWVVKGNCWRPSAGETGWTPCANARAAGYFSAFSLMCALTSLGSSKRKCRFCRKKVGFVGTQLHGNFRISLIVCALTKLVLCSFG